MTSGYDELKADIKAVMAPRDEDRMKETCCVCGEPAVGPTWWTEFVDPWGERLWGGYVCSGVCFRKAPAQRRKDLSA